MCLKVLAFKTVTETQSKFDQFLVKDYITNLDCNENILDKLAKKDFTHVTDAENFYPPHLTLPEIHKGIKIGKFRQGTFRASRDNFLEGSILLEGYDDPVSKLQRFKLKKAMQEGFVCLDSSAR